MDFGVVLQTDPPAREVVETMRVAEGHGFGYGWTFDSCVLWQEPFVIYSQILSATQSLIVGPMVTNPSTRDWSVTASLFATLNDMFGNRTVCGIGRGDSARRVIGQKPASLAVLGESMRVIKDLAEGREATLQRAQGPSAPIRSRGAPRPQAAGSLAPSLGGDASVRSRRAIPVFAYLSQPSLYSPSCPPRPPCSNATASCWPSRMSASR